VASPASPARSGNGDARECSSFGRRKRRCGCCCPSSGKGDKAGVPGSGVELRLAIDAADADADADADARSCGDDDDGPPHGDGDGDGSLWVWSRSGEEWRRILSPAGAECWNCGVAVEVVALGDWGACCCCCCCCGAVRTRGTCAAACIAACISSAPSGRSPETRCIVLTRRNGDGGRSFRRMPPGQGASAQGTNQSSDHLRQRLLAEWCAQHSRHAVHATSSYSSCIARVNGGCGLVWRASSHRVPNARQCSQSGSRLGSLQNVLRLKHSICCCSIMRCGTVRFALPRFGWFTREGMLRCCADYTSHGDAYMQAWGSICLGGACCAVLCSELTVAQQPSITHCDTQPHLTT